MAAAGGGSIALPITLDVTWTGLGATSVERDRGTFRCLSYSADSTNVFHLSGATASATVSGLNGTFTTDVAGVDSTDSHIDINETPPSTCPGV